LGSDVVAIFGLDDSPFRCFRARDAFIADKVRRCQKLIADAATKKPNGTGAGGGGSS